MSVMLLFFNTKNAFPLRTNYIYTALSITFLLTFYILVSPKEDFFTVRTFIFQAFTIIYIFIFISIFYSQQQTLLFKSINNSLLVFVSLWYLQLFSYYTTGYYPDFLAPFGGLPQRYEAYFASSALNIIRPTSLFLEPGTYAMAVLPYLSLSYLEERKLNKLHIFTLISFFLSLSAFAIIVASLFIFVVMMYKAITATEKNRLKMVSLFIISSFIILFILQTYNTFRFEGGQNQGQIDMRTNVINQWRNSDEKTLLLGHGYGLTDDLVSITDTSLHFRIIYDYGIMAIPFYILILYISWGFPVFFTLIILLTKVTYFHYHLWLYFSILMIIHRNRNST
jgi:hypothetical protein